MLRLCGYNTEDKMQSVDMYIHNNSNEKNKGADILSCNIRKNNMKKDGVIDNGQKLYTLKQYIYALKGYIYILPVILCIVVLGIMTMTGCSRNESKEHEVIDYTVVENEDLPTELKKLIDNKKANTLRMTYTTKDYTYVVAGFGTKETSGYSIKVNDVYKSGNAVYADFTLMGPAENEAVNEVSTTPYIVLKYEKRDESVVFKM